MKINNYQGFFVAIEGLDGSGADKITQALVSKMKKEGLPVLATKEPSNGPIGRVIKEFLTGKKRPLSPLKLEFLFAADRAWTMEGKIIPALKEGRLVVSDRCLWSSIAYRSIDLPIHWLLEINSRFIIPNITYFIDVSPQICAARIKKGEDEIQIFDEEERLVDIQEGYYWIFNKYPYWFKIIDGEKDQKEIIEEILGHLRHFARFKKLEKNTKN